MKKLFELNGNQMIYKKFAKIYACTVFFGLCLAAALTLSGCHINEKVMLGKYELPPTYSSNGYDWSASSTSSCWNAETPVVAETLGVACSSVRRNILSVSPDSNGVLKIRFSQLRSGTFPQIVHGVLSYATVDEDLNLEFSCETNDESNELGDVREVVCTPKFRRTQLRSYSTSSQDKVLHFRSIGLEDPECGSRVFYSVNNPGRCEMATLIVDGAVFPPLYLQRL